MNLPKRTKRAIAWWVSIGASGIVSLFLGYVGFRELLGPNHSAFDFLYLSWQLFTMESGAVDPPVPWSLEVARILAPLTSASAVGRVAYGLLRDRVRMFRLARTKNHVVIAGLGRRGLQLCDDARSRGYRVVALDEEISEQLRMELIDNGITPLQGDAAWLQSLRRARAGHAAHVFAVSGSDGVNVEIALNTHQLVLEKDDPQSGFTNCHVQVSDYALATQFKEHAVFKRTDDAFETIQFSSYENAARAALTEHPLDYDRIYRDDPRAVQLIILGFGQMGESLAIQAAKNGHYANGLPVRIHAIDRAAERRERSLRLRYPCFEKCAAITFRAAEFEDPDTVETVRSLALAPNTLSTISVCFDDDSKNVQYALSLRRALGDAPIPILVRLSEEIGLARLLRDHELGPIHPFGALSTASSWPVLMGEETDRMARFIHAQYVEEQRRLGKPEGPNTLPWNQLDHDLRDSNRRQADHIPVKLRAVGYDVRKAEEAAGLRIKMSADDIEMLARMEHARWNAERFLAGWERGDKDVSKKRSPYLVPYDELPNDIKQYDRDAVQNIVQIASKARESNP